MVFSWSIRQIFDKIDEGSTTYLETLAYISMYIPLKNGLIILCAYDFIHQSWKQIKASFVVCIVDHNS